VSNFGRLTIVLILIFSRDRKWLFRKVPIITVYYSRLPSFDFLFLMAKGLSIMDIAARAISLNGIPRLFAVMWIRIDLFRIGICLVRSFWIRTVLGVKIFLSKDRIPSLVRIRSVKKVPDPTTIVFEVRTCKM
jgi:hypothetical protein